MTDTPQHSRFDSPSAASRTEACPGSVALTLHLPDERNAASDAGTLCHWLAAEILSGTHGWVLDAGEGLEKPVTDAADYLKVFPDGSHQCPDVPNTLRVTAETCEIAQYYIDYCRRESVGAEVTFIEHRVAFNESLKVDGGAEGTIDFVALWPDRVLVVDLKAGYTKVMAGSQLKRYALGVREQYGHLADFEAFKLAIVQPKLDHIDEIELTDAELTEYATMAAACAWQVREAVRLKDDPTLDQAEWELSFLNPGEEQCRWCKAKAFCPALAKEVVSMVSPNAEGMEDLTAPLVPAEAYAPEFLGLAMSKVGMIEDWCKAVRAEVERQLVQGNPVAGYKLVQGRKGPRAWTNEQEVEKLLRVKFRLKVDEAFKLELISPAAAEKILGKQQKRWSQLEPFIAQSDGKPSVAPESDKRPALSLAPSADGMETISTPEDLYS